MSVHVWIREDLGEKGRVWDSLSCNRHVLGCLPTPLPDIAHSLLRGYRCELCGSIDPLPWPRFSSQDGLLDQAELVNAFVTRPGFDLVWADLLNT